MKATFYYSSHVSIGAMYDVVAFQAQGQKIDAYTLLTHLCRPSYYILECTQHSKIIQGHLKRYG